jgi:hypothetical protein
MNKSLVKIVAAVLFIASPVIFPFLIGSCLVANHSAGRRNSLINHDNWLNGDIYYGHLLRKMNDQHGGNFEVLMKLVYYMGELAQSLGRTINNGHIINWRIFNNT